MQHVSSIASRAKNGCLSLDRIEIAAPNELLTDEILRPTPLLSLWQDWAEHCTPKRQPLIAMLAGLTAFSAVMGRSYRGPTYCIPPLSVLVLAPPGAGKDHPQEMAKHFMHAVGMGGHLCAAKWGSGAGLERELQMNGERLAVSDEFGDIIESHCHPNCPGYKKDILTIVKQIYTGNDYAGSSIKDAASTMPCEKPRLAILASSQPVTFWRGVSGKIITDGFLSRMLVMPSTVFGMRDHRRNLGMVKDTMPQGIKDHVMEALQVRPPPLSPAHVMSNVVMPTEIHIPWKDAKAKAKSEDMIDQYDSLYNNYNERGLENEGALIARSFERAVKLAAVYAWTERTKDLCVSYEALCWADAIVTASDRCVMSALSEAAVDDVHAKRWQKYQRLLIGAKENGMSAATLIAHTRFSKNDHESIIKQMMASRVVTVSVGKRGGTYYVWTGAKPDADSPADRDQIFPAKAENEAPKDG